MFSTVECIAQQNFDTNFGQEMFSMTASHIFQELFWKISDLYIHFPTSIKTKQTKLLNSTVTELSFLLFLHFSISSN